MVDSCAAEYFEASAGKAWTTDWTLFAAVDGLIVISGTAR